MTSYIKLSSYSCCLEVERLTGKRKWNSWGYGNILYFDRGYGYIDRKFFKTHQTVHLEVCILLDVYDISILKVALKQADFVVKCGHLINGSQPSLHIIITWLFFKDYWCIPWFHSRSVSWTFSVVSPSQWYILKFW